MPHNLPRLLTTKCPAIAWIISFGLLVLLLSACGGSEAAAPDFQLTRFDGTQFKLSDQRGENSVVLNFWFPSCLPCREEMPAFESAWQRLRGEGQAVEFLGLFVPQGFDSEQDARDFVAELGLTYGFATDLGAGVAAAFGLEVYPTTFFIDKSGRIVKKQISAVDEELIVSTVKNMSRS